MCLSFLKELFLPLRWSLCADMVDSPCFSGRQSRSEKIHLGGKRAKGKTDSRNHSGATSAWGGSASFPSTLNPGVPPGLGNLSPAPGQLQAAKPMVMTQLRMC